MYTAPLSWKNIEPVGIWDLHTPQTYDPSYGPGWGPRSLSMIHADERCHGYVPSSLQNFSTANFCVKLQTKKTTIYTKLCECSLIIFTRGSSLHSVAPSSFILSLSLSLYTLFISFFFVQP